MQRSLSKLIALFRRHEDAERARTQVKTEVGLGDGQVRIFGPRQPGVRQADAVEESVGRSVLRAHLVAAFAGLLFGTVAWSALDLLDVVIVAATPLPSLIALALLGAFVGFLMGDAMPAAYEPMADTTPSAPRTGRWAVVVQPGTLAELERAMFVLQATGAPVVRTS